MRTLGRIVALFLGVICMCQVVSSSVARSITVTLRGKKYELSASTVGDIKKEMETKAGLSAGQQGILFKGKMLGNDESLTDAGVSDGDNLLVVPKSGFSRPRPSAGAAPSSGLDDSSSAGAPPSSSGLPVGGEAAEIFELLNSFTSDPTFQAFTKQAMVGGKGGVPNMTMEDMARIKKLTDAFMYKLVRSPVVKAYIDNDENMESLRLRLKTSVENLKSQSETTPELSQVLPLIENPMIQDALNDRDAFKKQILEIVNVYMNMEDPMTEDGSGNMSFDPSLLGAAKSDDEVEDLDNLPDDHKEL